MVQIVKKLAIFSTIIIAFTVFLYVIFVDKTMANADEPELCQYPNNFGGPFEGLPECLEGFHTEPLTCCRDPNYIDNNGEIRYGV